MPLQFFENANLSAEVVAALRSAAGWEVRTAEVKSALRTSYLTAACLDGALLVGFVDVISDGMNDALIRNLLVHPAYRRRGIGLQLLKIVIGRLQANQIKTINVVFEPELENLYRKAGFVIIGGGMITNKVKV